MGREEMSGDSTHITVSTADGLAWIDADEVLGRIPSLHFVRFYDAAEPGSRDAVDAKDWGLPALLNAAVPSSALQLVTDEYLVDTADALRRVSPDWLLVDDDADGERRESVRRLLKAITTPKGIGRAIATKMLHKKRPNLIPIVDSVIAGTYGIRRPADLIFGPFKDDLARNLPVLKVIADEASEVARRRVSEVRALELSIWLTFSPSQGLQGGSALG